MYGLGLIAFPFGRYKFVISFNWALFQIELVCNWLLRSFNFLLLAHTHFFFFFFIFIIIRSFYCFSTRCCLGHLGLRIILIFDRFECKVSYMLIYALTGRKYGQCWEQFTGKWIVMEKTHKSTSSHYSNLNWLFQSQRKSELSQTHLDKLN